MNTLFRLTLEDKSTRLMRCKSKAYALKYWKQFYPKITIKQITKSTL